jgi:hypothetical protein
MKFLTSAFLTFLSGSILVIGVWEAVIILFQCCNDSTALWLPFIWVWLGASPLIVWVVRRLHDSSQPEGEPGRRP